MHLFVHLLVGSHAFSIGLHWLASGLSVDMAITHSASKKGSIRGSSLPESDIGSGSLCKKTKHLGVTSISILSRDPSF